VEVLRFEKPAEFLDATKTFRSNDPVRTGLITSIASSVASGSRTYEGYFWWLAIANGDVQGLAIRTLPYGYVFSPMANDAAEAIYSFISVEDSTANEFAGPKSVIDYLEKVSGKEIAEEETELIYENRKLIPTAPLGEIRTAASTDYELIFKWMTEFMEETALRSFNLENMVHSAIDAGRYTLLEVEGTVVSLGGNSDIQVFDGFSIGRVGPIYTPLEHRKKGYASAITSAISEKLLNQGIIPTLYTQAANPTSNKIYQEIGYTLVDENRRIVFAQ
jgi:GNAT superfamily N-acetyltransferase